MPRYTPQDYAAVSSLLVPVAAPLDHDVFDQPTDQTDRLRQYLAGVLLDHPDWWPWVISRWAAVVESRFSTVAEYIDTALDGLAEGVHQPWLVPSIDHNLTHAELGRLAESIEKGLGKVNSGLRYSLDEMVEVLAQVGSLIQALPDTGQRWYDREIEQQHLLRYHLQQLTTNGEEVLTQLAAHPRLLWLAAKLMMSPRRASTTPAPYGDEPRDQLGLRRPSSGFAEPAVLVSSGTFPSTQSSVSISFDIDNGAVVGVLSAPGATAASVLTISEPFEFVDDQQPKVTSAPATYDISFVDAHNYWYAYVDGVKYTRDVAAGTYTAADMVAEFQQAVDSDGNQLSTVAYVTSTKVNTSIYTISVQKKNPGGTVIIGDGTTVNVSVGFTNWDSSDDDSNSRTVKGTEANNELSLKIDGSTITVYVTAGTYTASQLVTELEGNGFEVGLYDSVRVQLSSPTYGGASRLEVLVDQPVMGLTAGYTSRGTPARVEDLQLAAALYYPDDLKVAPTQPVPTYSGRVWVASSTRIILPSGYNTDDIETGMVVTILSGDQVGETMLVDSIFDPTSLTVDGTLVDVGENIQVDIRDGTFRLEAATTHYRLEVTSGEPFFPTSSGDVVAYARDNRWEIVSSKSALKWVRVGDVLNALDGQKIVEVGVELLTTDVLEEVTEFGVHTTNVGSADWDALEQLDTSHSLGLRMREYLNLVNSYRHRPGNDIRQQLIGLLTDWKSQVESVLSATGDYLEQVRELKEVETLVERLKSNNYDRAVVAFSTDPELLADLFPDVVETDQQHSWVSGQRVMAKARNVVRPPDTFDADVVVSDSHRTDVDGDVDVDVADYDVEEDLLESGQGLPWER